MQSKTSQNKRWQRQNQRLIHHKAHMQKWQLQTATSKGFFHTAKLELTKEITLLPRKNHAIMESQKTDTQGKVLEMQESG